jgi:hypothetical protein
MECWSAEVDHSPIRLFAYSPGSLTQGVQKAITEGQIGAPVFVRWVAANASEAAELLPGLGAMLEAAEAWLGSAAQRVYAVGGPAAGQVTAMVDYEGGQGALLTTALAPSPGPPHVNLTLLGQRGAVYHDNVSAFAFSPTKPSLSAARFATAVEESLRGGEPADIMVSW